MSVPENLSQNDAMRQYFDTLPPYVQETITQVGPKLATLEELKACAEKLMH